MPVDFDEGLVGAKPGEERHIEFMIAYNVMNPNYRGKMAGFDVTLHEIKGKVLPEPDDAFALETAGLETIEELRSEIREHLAEEKADEHKRLRQRRQVEKLTSRLECTVPELMATQRQQQMLRELFATLEQRKISLDMYFASQDTDMEKLEKEMLEQAERTLKEEFALEALARHEGMEITEEEVEEELRRAAKETGLSTEAMRKRWQHIGLMGMVNDRLLHRKALRWLDENTTVVDEVPASSDEEAADEAATDGADEVAVADEDAADEATADDDNIATHGAEATDAEGQE